MMIRILVIWSLIGALATSSHADGTATAAEAAFERGRALMKEAKYEQACIAFDQSQHLDPQLGTEYNLALCWMRIGKYASAWTAFREVAQRDINPSRRDQAAAKASELAPKLSRIHITASSLPPGVSVVGNGAPLTNLIDVESPIDPGTYDIVITAPGYKSTTVKVAINEPGQTTPVELPPLEKIPDIQPSVSASSTVALAHETAETEVSRGMTGKRKLATGLTAISAAGLVAGIVLGVQAKAKDREAATLCPDATCADATTANALLSSARGRALDANLAFGIAAVAAVSAGVLWYLGAPEHPNPRRIGIAPTASSGQAGLAVFGAF